MNAWEIIEKRISCRAVEDSASQVRIELPENAQDAQGAAPLQPELIGVLLLAEQIEGLAHGRLDQGRMRRLAGSAENLGAGGGPGCSVMHDQVGYVLSGLNIVS